MKKNFELSSKYLIGKVHFCTMRQYSYTWPYLIELDICYCQKIRQSSNHEIYNKKPFIVIQWCNFIVFALKRLWNLASIAFDDDVLGWPAVFFSHSLWWQYVIWPRIDWYPWTGTSCYAVIMLCLPLLHTMLFPCEAYSAS